MIISFAKIGKNIVSAKKNLEKMTKWKVKMQESSLFSCSLTYFANCNRYLP